MMKHKKSELIVQTKEDVLQARMRSRGLALMDEIMEELEGRDFSEVRTRDLMEFAIKLTGIYVPRPKPEAQVVPKMAMTQNISDVLGKIGLVETEAEVVNTNNDNGKDDNNDGQ